MTKVCLGIRYEGALVPSHQGAVIHEKEWRVIDRPRSPEHALDFLVAVSTVKAKGTPSFPYWLIHAAKKYFGYAEEELLAAATTSRGCANIGRWWQGTVKVPIEFEGDPFRPQLVTLCSWGGRVHALWVRTVWFKDPGPRQKRAYEWANSLVR